jgi:ribosomal protein S18 acetylase RimI-like enzyme
MKIYKAEKKDIIYLCDIWMELQDYHRNLAEFTQENENWRQLKEKELLIVIESSNTQIFVAKDSNNIIGYIRGSFQDVSPVFRDSRLGKIDELFVKGAYRRQDAGKMLVEYMKLWLKGKKASDIALHVSIDNEEGKRFWESMGFKTTSTRMTIRM